MKSVYRTKDTTLCVELFPEEWLGSSIQATVDIDDYSSEEVARAAALSVALERYHSINSAQLDAIKEAMDVESGF